MRLVITNNKKYGILYRGSVYDINTFEAMEAPSYSLLRSGKLHNLPNEELNEPFIKALRKKFPYTKIGNTYAFHVNWKQEFFVKINKDNTMNIYSGYPIFVLKRLLKFII